MKIVKIVSTLILSFCASSIFAANLAVKIHGYQVTEKPDMSTWNEVKKLFIEDSAKYGITPNVLKKADDYTKVFPRLEAKFGYEKGKSFDKNLIKMKFTFYDSNKKPFNYEISVPEVYISGENLPEKLSKFLVGFAPLVAKSVNDSSKTPIFIDSFVTSSYTGKEIPDVNQTAVVGFSDFSFVVRDNNRVTKYSPSLKAISNLSDNEKVSSSIKQSRNYFIPRSPDGKTLFIGKSDCNNVFSFGSKGNFDKKIGYDFPNESVRFDLTRSGKPIFISKNGDYFQKFNEDEKLENVTFLLAKNENVVTGNNDSIWSYDSSNGVLIAYSKDGYVEKIFYPYKIEDSERYSLSSSARVAYVCDDSSFFMLDKNEYNTSKAILIKYDSNGKYLWTMESDNLNSDVVMQDYRNGVYYFSGSNKGDVSRFADRTAQIPLFMKKISTLNSKLAENPKDRKSLLEIADCYKSDNGLWGYSNYLSRYLEKCPGDAKVSEKNLLAQVELLKVAAKEKCDRALSLYEEYGKVTATPEYQEAMKLLEKLKKQVPWDSEILSMYNELDNAFNGGASSSNEIPSLEINSIELTALFPAKISSYATVPSGVMTVTNKSKSPMKNVCVSAYVRKYMDAPSQGEVIPSIASGEKEVPVWIITQLNTSVLNLSEDTVVQMQYTLSWEENGKKKQTVVTRPATIYRKSAMSWDDASMLSCFIQPNDETVSNFVFANYKKNSEYLSDNISKVIQLSNALGSIPLNYVSDPVCPATDLVGNPYAIDTVRFPAETLAKKGGDCDDMTALFCSVVESAGVKTAIVTVPGHVFAAFDSGLKSNSVWEKKNGLKTLTYDGRVWIPIEITMLDDGFYEAWKTAGEECFDSNGKSLLEGFDVVSEARGTYPSVPTTIAAQKVSVNTSNSSKLSASSSVNVKNDLKESFVKAKNTSSNAEELNGIANVLRLADDIDNAIVSLEKAHSIDSKKAKFCKNLAVLYKSKGDNKKYEYWMNEANKLSSTSTTTATQSTSRAADANGDGFED